MRMCLLVLALYQLSASSLDNSQSHLLVFSIPVFRNSFRKAV